MRPEYAYNILDTLSRSPWPKPLNWDLHTTPDGEECIPFHLYVRPKNPYSFPSSQPSLFQDFNRLPTELQLRILSFCSAPTLFQIMHASVLRIEAVKFFWSDSNTYYFIEASWLLACGYPGHTCYDLSFMAYVQNVEIEYDLNSLNEWKIGRIRDDDYNVMEIDYEKTSQFWTTFQTRFPRAKRVVINKGPEGYTTDRQPYTEPVGPFVKVIIETCPVQIDVSAFPFLQKSSGSCMLNFPCDPDLKNDWERALYQLAKDGSWQKATASGFTRNTVFIPPKKFHGPVGEFRGLEYKLNRIRMRQAGLDALAIEALGRYYLDRVDPQPFKCPRMECTVHFDQAGPWIRHAAEMHWSNFLSVLQFDVLPNALQSIFEERKTALEQENELEMDKFRKMYLEWNEEGGEKRRKMERNWMCQLENDDAWNTGSKGPENDLFEYFFECVDSTRNNLP